MSTDPSPLRVEPVALGDLARLTPPVAWPSPFVRPSWLGAWARTVGAGTSPRVLLVRDGERLAGIAPLGIAGDRAGFLGSPDLCDHLDFVVAPGREAAVVGAVLDHLAAAGVRRIDLHAVRPDAAVRAGIVAGGAGGWAGNWHPAGESYEIDLPATWDAYLAGLGRRHRHELRRKLRRAAAGGPLDHRRFQQGDDPDRAADRFLALFRAGRADKAAFLTPDREAFFRAAIRAAAREGMLDLGFLRVDGRDAAATLAWDDGFTVWLYNSGYDPAMRHRSAGFAAKALAIRDAIGRGRRRYDLLGGAEPYKRRLGGRPVPLYRWTAHREPG